MTELTPTPERKKSSANIFYIAAIAVLVTCSIYLFANNRTKTHEATALTTQLDESNTRYADLDKQYSAALADVSSYKGQNKTLDSILTVKEKELVNFKSALNKARKEKVLSEAEYKKQLDQISAVVTDLTAQIETLQKEKNMLITKNDSLGKRVAEEVTLTAQLSETNKVLFNKVTVASLLIPKNIVVEGIKEKSSGKETTTSRASKVSELRLCFNIGENKIAEAGNKTFLARIISPEGTTLAVEDLGSGVFQVAGENEQRTFTTSQVVSYDQKPQNVCMFWKQKMPYSAGKYSAEIYQDGYFIGKTDFELK